MSEPEQTNLVDGKVKYKPKIAKDINLTLAEELAMAVQEEIHGFCIEIDVVGSIRRKRPTVNDVDFVVLTSSDKEWKELKDKLYLECDANKISSGQWIHRITMPWFPIIGDGEVQVDIYRSSEANYGLLKLVRTGSYQHNIKLARHALKNGMRLFYSRGILKEGNLHQCQRELDVFDLLGLSYVEPEDREVNDSK